MHVYDYLESNAGMDKNMHDYGPSFCLRKLEFNLKLEWHANRWDLVWEKKLIFHHKKVF